MIQTLYHGIHTARNTQDKTPLNQFYALAKQHNLQPNQESIEYLLN